MTNKPLTERTLAPCHSLTALGLAVALLVLAGALPQVAPAAGPRYVASAGSDAANDCALSTTPCATVQHAVDVAVGGDEIRVAAGAYTGVAFREGGSQMVYLDKAVTIRGGYATTDWTASYPVTRATTLDAGGQGRVLRITGVVSPVIEGLRMTGGSAVGDGAYGSGGAVSIISATAVVRGNWIYSSTAQVNGGGLYLEDSSSVVEGNTIYSNTVLSAQWSAGGGIYLTRSAATVTGNFISANIASGRGGGVLSLWGASSLRDNTVVSNTAFIGGGIALQGSGDVVAGNTFLRNAARDMTTQNGTFNGSGGGLSVESNSMEAVVTGNRFMSNTATSGGGVYLSDSAIPFTGNTLTGNTAGYWGGGLNASHAAAQIEGNTFTGNTAGAGGGAMCLQSSGLTAWVNRNRITGNAGGLGGGLFFQRGSDLVEGNEIINNSAAQGGGVYFNGGGGTLVNNVIADNQASESGSGIYAFASSPVLIHSTIARNTGGDASGLLLADQVFPEYGTYNYSHVVLTNTVLVSHSVGISLAMAVSNTVTLNGTLWQSDTQKWAGGGMVTSTRSIDGDAAFAADGYHLTAGSAARGGGVNASLGGDIDGEPRRNPPDLGADEFWAPGELKRVYLPIVMRSQ